MIRRDLLSFATLDVIPALDEDGLKPMKSNHSVRVQSESIRWQLMLPTFNRRPLGWKGSRRGIRTRVYSLPRAFLTVSGSYVLLTQHRTPPGFKFGGCFDPGTNIP
jgi:hypothetical protein